MEEDDRLEYIRLMQAEIDELEKQTAESNRAAMLALEEKMVDKFRTLREERGWSQTDLSKQLAAYGFELHQTTIAKLEKHSRPLRVAEMYALSHVFRLPIGAVFFMARTNSDPVSWGMDALTKNLGDVTERMEDMRQMLFRQIEQAIDLLGDYQTQRNELADLMRRAAVQRPTDE